ncbi:hypothetical protein [Tenacibaculum agarivorans]|uniref:hypothetical protein n=1 Tax=Tenacibaculum agarivorans TaxID=1908389 RepID=UPI000A858B5A|nr:hypothetical protein [Tenacibaculum agarivorans]
MNTYKSIFLFTFLSFFIGKINGQDKAELLNYPKEWRFEKINFPLDFAKDITWEGFEELRFSPGMFDVKSATYFTYYFAIQIQNKVEISEKEIKDMLEKYYRGLCKAVNAKDKFTINYNDITATIKKTDSCSLTADIVFFDSFTNGKKLNLAMMMEIQKNNESLLLITSVTPKQNIKELETLHKNNIKNNLLKR